jgi:glycine/D-amino acid oxidase-like deaminating enzyme
VSDPAKSTAVFQQQLQSAADFSYNRYTAMLSAQSGVRRIVSYAVSRDRFRNSDPSTMQSAFRGDTSRSLDLRPDEHPFAADAAVRQTDTLQIEPPIYLQAMLDAFRGASGEIAVKAIADRACIARLPEKLIFNCTGLGAKEIFDDAELTPVRGQLTLLRRQPEVRYEVSHDELYMLPRTDGIVLGGTYELGDSSLTPDMEKMRSILARHRAFFNSYRHTSCRMLSSADDRQIS